MKGLIKFAAAAAAGYSVARVIEAKALNVPLSEVFSLKDGVAGLLRPVSKIALLQVAPLDVVPRT